MGLDADTTEHVYKIELNGAILLGYGPWRDQSEPFIKYSCFSYESIAKSISNGVSKCIKISIIENDTIKIVFNGLSIQFFLAHE